jgi:hypothetical protein
MCGQEEALSWESALKKVPAKETIIFIVGGTTYEVGSSLLQTLNLLYLLKKAICMCAVRPAW